MKWEMGGGMQPAPSRKKGLLDAVEETQDTDRQMLEQSFARVELKSIPPFSTDPENGDVPREFPGL